VTSLLAERLRGRDSIPSWGMECLLPLML